MAMYDDQQLCRKVLHGTSIRKVDAGR